MDLVLFLGAGFSRRFGHPMMNEFLAYADTCPRLDVGDRTLLERLALSARSASSFLESSPTNLEDILSFAVMAERLGIERDEDESGGERLRSVIGRVYSQRIDPNELPTSTPPLQDLLGCAPREFEGRLSVVTTNYDLNAETLFVNADRPLSLESPYGRVSAPLDFVAGQRVLYTPHADGIGASDPLFKLHGSVNWYESEAGPPLVEDRLTWGRKPGRTPGFLSPTCCHERYVRREIPLIVPPSFLKPELPDILRRAWKGAARALARATQVAFVGYSFPPSDVEMSYFLATSLAGNVGLRKIIIVDPAGESIKARLTAAGSKFGPHFRGLLHFVNEPWGQNPLPLK